MARAVLAPQRSQQRLQKMTIRKLKHLRDLELDFQGKALVGLMGPNGCGKTTVLHALACAFIPSPSEDGYRFPFFFLPTSDSKWTDSEFSVLHRYQLGTTTRTDTTVYKKGGDRWSPRVKARPVRPTIYISLQESVPAIETFRTISSVKYQDDAQQAPNTTQVLNDLSVVMGRQYEALSLATVTTSYHKNKKLHRVRFGDVTYPTLSMSSGEQRVLRILASARALPKHGLLLVDELDMFLHPQALSRLVDRLDLIAQNRELQVVFTCHAPHLWESASKCDLFQLWQAGGKTLVMEGQHPDSVFRLTGQQVRPLQLYCEDNVARAILRKVLEQLSIERYCEITCFGSASNAFTVAASVVLENKPTADVRVVLDGDVMSAQDERARALDRVLSGNGQPDIERRQLAGQMVLALDHGGSPEEFLIANGTQAGGSDEINVLLAELGVLPNPHDVIVELARRLGDTEDQCLRRLVDNASLSPNWPAFVAEVDAFLVDRKAHHNLGAF